ncbi:hypothetical protein BCR35DRAFT_149590 [Leucosporidium creatinivorum]|uniref:Uncharacterized protein n=1 Tax=Leucosporidium creatinivorum TaxID=106004 RepID=A0A1Y2EPE0_9BASI|nr:hypothetical protein BCR35DRAFT_149590 [Leucosporidium creatinivorum]
MRAPCSGLTEMSSRGRDERPGACAQHQCRAESGLVDEGALGRGSGGSSAMKGELRRWLISGSYAAGSCLPSSAAYSPTALELADEGSSSTSATSHRSTVQRRSHLSQTYLAASFASPSSAAPHLVTAALASSTSRQQAASADPSRPSECCDTLLQRQEERAEPSTATNREGVAFRRADSREEGRVSVVDSATFCRSTERTLLAPLAFLHYTPLHLHRLQAYRRIRARLGRPRGLTYISRSTTLRPLRAAIFWRNSLLLLDGNGVRLLEDERS